MKRSLCGFVPVLVVLSLTAGNAQTPYVGVVGGVNLADLDIEFVDEAVTGYDVQSRTLFGVGAFIGASVNEYLSVEIDPMYLQKGGTFTRPPTPDMRIKSDQLELPLLLKAGIGETVRPYVMGGVFMSFVLNATLEVEMAGRSWEGDLDQILKSTEYGILFGAGVSYPVWKGLIFIEGRYALGLTNLNEGGTVNLTSGSLVLAGPQTGPQDEIKTRGIQILAGFQLPLGGE